MKPVSVQQAFKLWVTEQRIPRNIDNLGKLSFQSANSHGVESGLFTAHRPGTQALNEMFTVGKMLYISKV